MHLKEDSHSTAELPSTSSVEPKVSTGAKKCKVYVNGTTCSAAAGKQTDDKPSTSDKNGNVLHGSLTCKDAMESETNSSELASRIEALDLNLASHISNGDTPGNAANGDITQGDDAAQSGPSNGDVTQNGLSHNDVTQNGSSEVTQKEPSNGDITQNESSNGDVTQNESSNGDITQNGSSNGYIKQNGSSNGHMKQNGMSYAKVTQNGASSSTATQNGTSSRSVTQNGSSVSGATQNGSSVSGATQNGASVSGATQRRKSSNSVQQSGLSYADVTQRGTSYAAVTQNSSLLSNGSVSKSPEASQSVNKSVSEQSSKDASAKQNGVVRPKQNGIVPPVESSPGSPTELVTYKEFVPTSPDSGLSAESQESDGACSPISDPSVDGSAGAKCQSPCGSEDRLQDFNENLLDIASPGLEVAAAEQQQPKDSSVEVFEFEIPQELCGLLIGRNGRYVKHIKQESNADIFIKHHAFYTHLKTCIVYGTASEITHALELIRDRFPADKYPDVTLSYLQRGGSLPAGMRLTLPAGVTFEVIVSAVLDPLHFFVHQPTLPAYHTLPFISSAMTHFYNSQETPTLVHFAKTMVVAAPLGEYWYRGEIMELNSDDTALVKLLDFGNCVTIALNELRQLNGQFLQFPFQATECLLSCITYPDGANEWSEEGTSAFAELTQNQIVNGYVTGYAENGLPFVHLFKFQNGVPVLINQEMVSRGFASWLEDGEILEITE